MEESISGSLSLQERIKIIQHFVCFSMLNVDVLTQLSQQAFEAKYSKGQEIVKEGELIDTVYIIVSGTAEVTHSETEEGKIVSVLLEKLGPGESIGLSDTGFYSQTGVRTATVTATSDMYLLGITLENFQKLLKQIPEILPAMQGAAEEMMRMNFIKQLEPFADLSYEQLRWLAQQIENIEVESGTYLFKEGETPTSCYFLRSGKVIIEVTQSDNKTHTLATLAAPALFGEAAILMDAPRSASAHTLEKCQLYVLRRDRMTELFEQNSTSAKFLMRLMMDRSRPAHASEVSAHHQKAVDGQVITTLRNTSLNKYYQLAPEGWFIWQQMNGVRTIKDIILLFYEKYRQFIPGVISSLIFSLAQLGFVELRGFTLPREEEHLSSGARWMRKIRQVMEATYSFGNFDAWLTKSYQNGVKFLFTWPAQIIFLIIIVSGIYYFGFSATRALHQLHYHTLTIWEYLVAIDILALFVVLLHELAHAFTTKFYGHEVRRMGVGWYWIGPIAFTDTSDMWLSTRWPRTVVNIAGIYIDLVVGDIFAIIAWLVPNSVIALFFWLFSAFIYLNVFRNLNPVSEFDGYYILADLFERPHLRNDAVTWLLEKFTSTLRHPKLLIEYKLEVIYWCICIIYIAIAAFITWLTLYVIFGRVFPILQSHEMRWIIPSAVVVFSIFLLWAQVRIKRKNMRQ